MLVAFLIVGTVLRLARHCESKNFPGREGTGSVSNRSSYLSSGEARESTLVRRLSRRELTVRHVATSRQRLFRDRRAQLVDVVERDSQGSPNREHDSGFDAVQEEVSDVSFAKKVALLPEAFQNHD